MGTPSSLLDPAMSLKAVKKVVAQAWEVWRRADYRLALGLRRLFDDGAHRGAGKGNFGDWAEFTWGIPRKQAWTFCFLGEHLKRLPALREAMEEGRVTYTKAREFAAVAQEEDIEWWLEYASGHSHRQVLREMEKYQARKAGKDYEPVVKVRSELSPQQAQTARKLREEITKTTGKPVKSEELFGKALDLMKDQKVSGDGEVTEALHQPHLSLQLCPSCLTSWVPVPGENLEVMVSQWIEALRDGAEVTEAIHDQLVEWNGEIWRRDECPGWTPPPWTKEISRYVATADRRHIEARDGHRCSVPGCSSPGPLNWSHLTAFADGGPSTPDNIRMHCATDNQLIEKEALFVVGQAPFEKYYLRDGTFLGWGYDPVPFKDQFPHVGKDGRVSEGAPPEWNRRQKTPA